MLLILFYDDSSSNKIGEDLAEVGDRSDSQSDHCIPAELHMSCFLSNEGINMIDNCVSQAEVNMKGEKETQLHSVDNLIDSMDSDIVSSVADTSGQTNDENQEAPVEVFVHFVSRVTDVKEKEKVESRGEERVAAWVSVLC